MLALWSMLCNPLIHSREEKRAFSFRLPGLSVVEEFVQASLQCLGSKTNNAILAKQFPFLEVSSHGKG